MRITIDLDERERAALVRELSAALMMPKAAGTAPTLEDVQAYADAQEWEPRLFNPADFYRYNSLHGWAVRDWRLAANGWYAREAAKHPEWKRPDYSDPWGND